MWTEISRRCDTDAEDSLALSFLEVVVFSAEIAVQQGEEILYCTASWAPFMPEFTAFEVTHESIFDYLVNLELEDGGNLERIRRDSVLRVEADDEYDGEFSVQFHEMLRMIAKLAAEYGYRTETYDDSDDLDDL